MTYTIYPRTGKKPEITTNKKGETIMPPTKQMVLAQKDMYRSEGRTPTKVKSSRGRTFYIDEIPKNGVNQVALVRRDFNKKSTKRSRKRR